jgi:hypothetical protein
VDLLGEAEPLAHRGERHPVDVVDGLGRLQLGQGVAPQPRGGLQPGGGEVVEVLLVAGDPEACRRDRAEVDEGGQEVVGDLVDGGGWAGAGGLWGHAGERTPAHPRRHR